MDINSPEFAKMFIDVIDARVEKKLSEVLAQQRNWAVGKVASGGSGATVSLYINNSTTAVDVKNPRSFTLVAGQLVAVIFPNGRNDQDKYIDRIL